MATQVLDFVPNPLLIRPTHSGGDDDFWGPPQFSLHAWLANRGTYIQLLVEATWEEPKPDHTTFTYRQTYNLYDILKSKGPGWRFVGFDDQYDFNIDQQTIPDSDGGLKRITGPLPGGLVSTVDAVGDAWGGWFGGADHPYAHVVFNRVRFNVTNDPA
jgi:hypothetical protein